MKDAPIHIRAKTVFVGSSSTESRRINSFHNLLSFNHYFRKYFKLVYTKSVVTVTLTTGMIFFLFTCMHFWVWRILRRWPAHAPTAYEVVRDCRKFEKHWSKCSLLCFQQNRTQVIMTKIFSKISSHWLSSSRWLTGLQARCVTVVLRHVSVAAAVCCMVSRQWRDATTCTATTWYWYFYANTCLHTLQLASWNPCFDMCIATCFSVCRARCFRLRRLFTAHAQKLISGSSQHYRPTSQNLFPLVDNSSLYV
jgi:hypothetical protein